MIEKHEFRYSGWVRWCHLWLIGGGECDLFPMCAWACGYCNQFYR